MSNISRTRNPLNHNGTSQYERLLEALTPEYFKIDDRSLKDLLHATYQHSQTLTYYNEKNEADGDWSSFWKVEMLTFLAHLSTMDVEKIGRDYEKIKADFHAQLAEVSGEEFITKSNEFHLALINNLQQQALQIEEAIQYLPETLPLRQEIISLIEKDSITDTEQLAGTLSTLIGFHKEAHQRTFDDRLDSDGYQPLFKKYWGISDKLAFYDVDHSDDYRFNDQAALDKLLKAFYQTLKKIKLRANYWFDRNLDTPQLRQPHVALFLTFLRLFNHARNSLNSLTRKHLEFYYEKVLCLRKQSEVPDDAYLILDLAATVDQHLIEKGTAFIGGQDANGRPLIFETIENWFLNRAQVKDIKTTYIDRHGLLTKKEDDAIIRTKQILAASDVTIAYKNGEVLPNDTYDSWRGMGDNIDLPDGEIGFAIASPQLILREGKRIIHLNIKTNQLVPLFSDSVFKIAISKEDGMQSLDFNNTLTAESQVTGFNFLQNLTINIANLEATRRLIIDSTTDISNYLPNPQNPDDANIAAIYQLSTQKDISLVSKNIFFAGYSIIGNINIYLKTATDNERIMLYFYRAYCFWVLSRVYTLQYTAANGAVKTSLPKLNNNNEQDGNFTINELATQINDDLDNAIALLGNDDSSNPLIINKWIVLAFKGKVLLQQQKYAEANALFDRIINSGIFSLENSINNSFQTTANNELIWAIDFDDFKDCVDGLADFSLYNIKDVNGAISTKRSLAANEKLIESYSITDERKQFFTILNTDPLFPTSNHSWNNKYYLNRKPQIIMIRYAEILLNAAICDIQQGSLERARELINQIRLRAKIEPLSSPFSSKNEGLNLVLEERLRELAFEGDRRDILQILEKNIPTSLGEINWDDERLSFKIPSNLTKNFYQVNTKGILGTNLCFFLNLNHDFPPVVQLQDDSLISRSSEWPMIQIRLNKEVPFLAKIYSDLRNIKLLSVEIIVDVKDVRENLIIQNDTGVFNGTQKFYPFGPIPEIRDHFYIGSTEVFQKSVENLTLNFKWINEPSQGFLQHYINYDTNIFSPQLIVDFLDQAEFPKKKSSNFPNVTYSGVLDAFGTIRGTVFLDSNEPAIGANVIVQGTSLGTTVDLDGNFSLDNVSSENNLEFSYMGFTTINVPILGSIINVILESAIEIFELIENDKLASQYQLEKKITKRDIRAQNFTKYTPTLPRGFVRFTLDNQDFLHKEYQNLLTIKSIEAATVDARKRENIQQLIDQTSGEFRSVAVAELQPILDLPPVNNLPNAPYTPATNGISLDYTSTQVINLTGNIDQYYHLYPFKGYAAQPLKKKEGESATTPFEICLLPQYNRPSFIPNEANQLANGNLYIGLENLKPGSNLSLLIQMQEGSAPNPDVAAPKVDWAYLAKNNEWKPLSSSKILLDTTEGLKRTGIFQLTTPKDMVSETTLFEGGCYWLRVAVSELLDDKENLPEATLGMPSIVGIRAQAISVQFKNQENELSHLGQPLPAGEIGQLSISRSAVKGIEQPFSSFNGQLPEAGNMFFVRVSERLRHRDRAVNIYDYERLLLEDFPKIQRAKCLNHTKPGRIDILNGTVENDIELAPGYVTISVIPELKKRSGEAAAEPRFSQGDLVEMANFLRKKTNLFVAGEGKDEKDYLRVVNPLYEEVQLCFKVQFKKGEAPEVRKFDLDEALKGYLAPWLYDKKKELTFGRKLNRSKIILFIEQLSYVAAIADFEMIHCGEKVIGKEIIPTTSRSILTTVIGEDDNPDTPDHKIEWVDNIC